MAKFRFGDRVTFKEYLCPYTSYEGISVDRYDTYLFGRTVTISGVDPDDNTYTLVELNGWYGESMFQDVYQRSHEARPKFSKGTRLKFKDHLVIFQKYGSMTWKRGDEHLCGTHVTVENVDPDLNRYQMLELMGYGWFSEEMFEVVEQGNQASPVPQSAVITKKQKRENLEKEVRYLREELRAMRQSFTSYVEDNRPKQVGGDRKAIHIQ